MVGIKHFYFKDKLQCSFYKMQQLPWEDVPHIYTEQLSPKNSLYIKIELSKH